MSDQLTVKSHAGPYTVTFDDDALRRLSGSVQAGMHFVVDERVAELYAGELEDLLGSPSVLRIRAEEGSKSLDRFPAYVERLVGSGVRRSHTLIAVGGGVIQDIVCFLAATMLRGLPWHFYPTTLLAQADSCIGSKSSINVGAIKNVLGTFTPPREIWIADHVLGTLDDRDIRSGVGEMLKVHAIDGPEAFDRIGTDYRAIVRDPGVRRLYIRDSLKIKRRIIEQDEFDRGLRNVMNYGHSFGHAIESATDFAVPHGLAVTIGMDMANYVAYNVGVGDRSHYERMHPTLAENYAAFARTEIPLKRFFTALSSDKKNTDGALTLILPDKSARVHPGTYPDTSAFREICERYLSDARTQ